MQFAGQQRLFAGEVVSIEVQCHHDGPEGWQVRVNDRRDLEAWGDRVASFYSGLSRQELLDVVCAELERLLQ